MNDTTVLNEVRTYNVDTAHSQVGFKVRHMAFSKVAGRFGEYSATIRINPDDLSTLEAEATIQTGSIDTGNSDRDAHLRSGDFFDSESIPTMTFRSKGVTNIDGNDFRLEGELTIRDVTHPITLKGEYLGTTVDPWGNDRVGFEAKGSLNRKEYGLTWNKALETGGLLVGEEVEIFLELQGVAASESAEMN